MQYYREVNKPLKCSLPEEVMRDLKGRLATLPDWMVWMPASLEWLPGWIAWLPDWLATLTGSLATLPGWLAWLPGWLVCLSSCLATLPGWLATLHGWLATLTAGWHGCPAFSCGCPVGWRGIYSCILISQVLVLFGIFLPGQILLIITLLNKGTERNL